MSRARNIKPGFLTNGELLECDPLTRILFLGLWMEADRRGILEDRPKTIKVKVLPADNCDVDAMLTDLQARGFIERYQVGGVRCIKVTNFSKHQNPHVNEKNSDLPDVPTESTPAQSGASTVQAPEQNSTNPADSFNLIPDPLIPVTNEQGQPTVVAPQAAKTAPDGPKPEQPKPERPKSQGKIAAERLYERRMVIFEAYCRGLGIALDSLPANQRKGPSLNALSPVILDTPECSPDVVEPLTRFAATKFKWREGRTTPSLAEVLAALPEWEEAGRPEQSMPSNMKKLDWNDHRRFKEGVGTGIIG